MESEVIVYDRIWTRNMIQQISRELALIEELKSSLRELRRSTQLSEPVVASTLKDVETLERSMYVTKNALAWYEEISEHNLQVAVALYEESREKTIIEFD